MKFRVVLFLGISVLMLSCNDEVNMDTTELSSKEREILLDKKIEEAQKIFKKYGWVKDKDIDMRDPEFRREYEEMDLEVLEQVLSKFNEGLGSEDLIPEGFVEGIVNVK
ncbi:hypothetical protein [Myroides sp. N17-2]|uniref:hypothetical protein n=1 Tax=Myroides sp. N17-2 TaxID=2030799 RepID=UPI000EFC11C1|nr:hypothetical protein [Myroides sp. N17-2]